MAKKKTVKQEEPKEAVITLGLNRATVNVMVEALRQSKFPSDAILPLAAGMSGMMAQAEKAWAETHKDLKPESK